MYQAVIFSFKVSQNFIVYESAEDRNLRAIFNRVKMHYLAIFLPNSIATRMPYLPAKDELVSLDRLSSRGLWKWYNSKGFGPATTWRGAAFHFLAVFSKMKILWKLWLWFSKMFHQRVLSDWKWSISKFQFWRRILDIYRQPLLKIKTLFKWGLKLLLKYKIVIKAFANQRHHQGWENIPRGAIFIFKNRCNLLVCAEIKRFYLHSSLKKTAIF